MFEENEPVSTYFVKSEISKKTQIFFEIFFIHLALLIQHIKDQFQKTRKIKCSIEHHSTISYVKTYRFCCFKYSIKADLNFNNLFSSSLE